MSKTSCLCPASAAALPCVFLRLRKRRQSEDRAKTLCENETESGNFPSVFKCKDSADLRHGKLFQAENVTFPTFKKKRLSLVAKEALFGHKGIVWTGNIKPF